MGDVIPVRPFHSDSLIECLAEVRMIWRDKVEQTLLLSLRLYFLPENTPKGRSGHGEVIFLINVNHLSDCKCASYSQRVEKKKRKQNHVPLSVCVKIFAIQLFT